MILTQEGFIACNVAIYKFPDLRQLSGSSTFQYLLHIPARFILKDSESQEL